MKVFVVFLEFPAYNDPMNKKQKYQNRIAILEARLFKMERDGQENLPDYAKTQQELSDWEICLADLERDEQLEGQF